MIRVVDIVVDGTDHFRTRFLLKAACWRKRFSCVYGGIFGLKGSAMTIIPGQIPCLECFMTAKDEMASPIPAIGPFVGLIATIQTMEVLKIILHLGELLAGELLLFDGGRMIFRKFSIKKRNECSVCSGL